jgi:hypothetical protein
MEAASTSETLVNFYQTTQYYNPEDSHLHVILYFTLSQSVYFTQMQHFKLHDPVFCFISTIKTKQFLT